MSVDDDIFVRLPEGWIFRREPKSEEEERGVKKPENPFTELQRDGRPKTIRYAAWEIMKEITTPMSEDELARAMEAKGLRPETPTNLVRGVLVACLSKNMFALSTDPCC